METVAGAIDLLVAALQALATRVVTILIVIATLGIVPAPSSCAESDPLEYRIKAAFLLNFTRFVEWPPTVFTSPESPVSICVLGDDPFGATLDQIVAGETANGRRIVVARVKAAPVPKSCQIVFSNQPERDHKIAPGVEPGVLSVGEGEGFAREGGMIGFVIEDRRVRLEINRTAARKAGLRLNSNLLRVAKTVIQ